MIGAWVGIVVGLLLIVGGGVSMKKGRRTTGRNDPLFTWGGLVAIVIGLILAIGCAFWLYGTEGGARAQKSFQSDTGGGLTRVVTVYDMEGEKIGEYEGKFDVDANAERIIFDIPREDGTSKRVQIWSSTGTVIIEEK